VTTAVPIKMPQPLVWLLPLVNGLPQWDPDWETWFTSRRLVVQKTSTGISNSGTASFQLLRALAIDDLPGEKDFADIGALPSPGQYVLVTTAQSEDGKPVTDEHSWIGTLVDVELESIPDGDVFGRFSAVEIATSLLDSQRLAGWRMSTASPPLYPRRIETPPPFNLAGYSDAGGDVTGNGVLGTTDNGETVYLFASELSQCGSVRAGQPEKIWTPWRILGHLALFCVPAGAPKIWIRCSDGSGLSGDNYAYAGISGLAKYLDSTESPASHDLDGLTWKGALDYLCGSSSCLGWKCRVGSVGGVYGLIVTIFPLSQPKNLYGPPRPEGATVAYKCANDYTKDVKVYESDAQRYDEVIVEGAPILFAASLSIADDNLTPAWTAGQLASYNSSQAIKRKAPEFADVYTSYLIKRQSPTSSIKRRALPGDNASAEKPLVCKVTFQGGASPAVAVDEDVEVNQEIPSLRLADFVPWRESVDAANTDSSGADISATPRYLRPQVFRFDATLTPKWVDLLSRVKQASFNPASESPAIEIDERRPGIRIAYTRPHALGLGTFTGTENGDQTPVYDYRKLLVTVGVPSPQRLRATVTRDGVPEGQLRRTLYVRDEALRLWIAHAGTVLATSADGSEAQRVAERQLVCNDYPAAMAWARELSEWAFRPKRTAQITEIINQDGVPAGFSVGSWLSKIQDGAAVRNVGSVIASIEIDWTAGEYVMTTEQGPQPSQRGRGNGGSSPAPSSGGPVSAELGGTVPQVVQKLETRIRELAAQVASRPLIPAMGGSSAPVKYRAIKTDGNQVIYSSYGITVTGIKASFAQLTELPAATPVAGGSYPDGIHSGLLISQSDGSITSARVWISCHASFLTSGGASVPNPLSPAPAPNGSVMLSALKITMNVTGGGTADLYVCQAMT
jgi:hypothetical protein